MRTLNYMLLLCLISLAVSWISAAPATRQRRQIDLTVSADHKPEVDETELALEAIAGLWSSADSRTKVDGSARLVHRSNQMQTGTGFTSYSARLHVHHDYKNSN